MTKHFDVTIRTDAKGLPTILALLDGEADLIAVKQVVVERAVRERGAPRPRGADGVNGQDLLNKFLETRKIGTRFGASEVVKNFVANGFAPGSASSRLSHATKESRIKPLGGGFYEVLK